MSTGVLMNGGTLKLSASSVGLISIRLKRVIGSALMIVHKVMEGKQINKIKALVTFYSSKSCRYGNSYWAYTYTDTESGKDVNGQCGLLTGDSNLQLAVRLLHPTPHGTTDWDVVRINHVEKKVREFGQMVKDWHFSGSDWNTIAAYIKTTLDPATCSNKSS